MTDDPKFMSADDLTRRALGLHQTPGDAMAQAARKIMAAPSSNLPALASALVAVKGKGPARRFVELLLEEIGK